MTYWILLIVFIAVLIAIGLFIWKKRIKDDDMENRDFITLIVIASVVFVLTVILSIDIPNALSGGKEIYVNELPTSYRITQYFSQIVTDNQDLRHLKGVAWNKYEKNGNYRIRYTKFTKFVLSIEKVNTLNDYH